MDFAALPTAPAPTTGGTGGTGQATRLASAPGGDPSSGIGTPLLALVVVVGLAIALPASRTLLRERSPRHRPRRRYYVDD